MMKHDTRNTRKIQDTKSVAIIPLHIVTVNITETRYASTEEQENLYHESQDHYDPEIDDTIF